MSPVTTPGICEHGNRVDECDSCTIRGLIRRTAKQSDRLTALEQKVAKLGRALAVHHNNMGAHRGDTPPINPDNLFPSEPDDEPTFTPAEVDRKVREGRDNLFHEIGLEVIELKDRSGSPEEALRWSALQQKLAELRQNEKGGS